MGIKPNEVVDMIKPNEVVVIKEEQKTSKGLLTERASHLRYVFLDEGDINTVFISSNLNVEKEHRLL